MVYHYFYFMYFKSYSQGHHRNAILKINNLYCDQICTYSVALSVCFSLFILFNVCMCASVCVQNLLRCIANITILT